MLALQKVSVSPHVTIEAELAGDLSPSEANSATILQVLMILLTKASDAISDAPGLIRILARRVSTYSDANANRVSIHRDQVQIEISDTGRGMPPERQARVFDPFFSAKSAGGGLGLAVVDGIVRTLGGSLYP
jgi:two-component system cell cycle sensor histidine kinase/response regulator CckA